MKKEVKIGIFALVMLLSLWAGIRFLSGIDIFSRNIIYYIFLFSIPYPKGKVNKIAPFLKDFL